MYFSHQIRTLPHQTFYNSKKIIFLVWDGKQRISQKLISTCDNRLIQFQLRRFLAKILVCFWKIDQLSVCELLIQHISDLIKFARLNVSHNPYHLSNPDQFSFVTFILKSPITIRFSNLFTGLLKEIVTLSKKYQCLRKIVVCTHSCKAFS